MWEAALSLLGKAATVSLESLPCIVSKVDLAEGKEAAHTHSFKVIGEIMQVQTPRSGPWALDGYLSSSVPELLKPS